MSRPERLGVPVALVVLAVFVMALNLRMGISSVGPVLPFVLHDLRAGLVAGSLLTALPVVMMGLMSPWSARLAGRYGVEWTCAGALIVVAAALGMRMWTIGSWMLLVSALILGGGIAAGNTMLPAVVGRYFPTKTALMTGVYTVGINLGAGSAAYATPGLAGILPSTWRGALGFWAIPAVLAATLWVVLAARTPRPQPVPGSARFGSGRQAAILALLFGLQSMAFYGVLAWLAPLYEDRGWSASRAGLLVFAFTATGIVGSMFASVLVQRTGRLVGGLRSAALLFAAMLALVAVTPTSAPWLWAVGLGLGSGGIFTLVMTVPLRVTWRVEDTRRLTGLMLCYGYLLAATGPFLVGLLRSLTGGFVISFLVLSLLGVSAALVARPAAVPLS